MLVVLQSSGSLAVEAHAAPTANLHFSNGRILKQCQLRDVVSDFIAYRCHGQQQVTAHRSALAHPLDTLTLRQGKTVIGEIKFTDRWWLEVQTSEGLQRLRNRQIEAIALGNAAVQPQATGSVIGGASEFADDDLGNNFPDDDDLDATTQDITPEGNPVERITPVNETPTAPVALPASAQPQVNTTPKDPDRLTPTPEVKGPKHKPNAKPVKRRLITPTISPWRIDKPYDGYDRMY